MKGFIQIPILIAILISAIVFGGGGYLIAQNISHRTEPSPSLLTATTTSMTQTIQTTNDVAAQKATQGAVNSGFYCNGNYFPPSCPSGRKLQCPPTGDATCVRDTDVLCNGKYWAQCPTGQTLVCPVTGEAVCEVVQAQATQSVKNYHDDMLNRVSRLISIRKAYSIWLQDTSSQFRSASLTLATYPKGGVYGDLIDASINLANASVTAISKAVVNNYEWISFWEKIMQELNSHPEEVVNSAMYEKLESPESLNEWIDGEKASLNSSLAKVMDTLKYH